VIGEGKVPSGPEALADWLGPQAPEACRIGLETGPLSVWLWNELKARGLPVQVIATTPGGSRRSCAPAGARWPG
jgi:transposase